MLKGLTASPALTYGAVTISDGADVVASLSGLPIGRLVSAGAGASANGRVTVTLRGAELVEVDDERADVVIANYVKARGHGAPDAPRCLDVVEAQLRAGRMVIVTKGVLTAASAAIAPDAGAAQATACGAAPGAPGAPRSACASVSLGGLVGVSVAAEGGASVSQSASGAVYAIIPAKLAL